MSSVSSPISRGRVLQQVLPYAPSAYDQTYLNQLINAVNSYMTQASAPGDQVAGRFIWSLPVIVGPSTDPNASLPDTSTLPTGMLYLKQVPGAAAGTYFLTVVMPNDPAARGQQPTDKL